MTNAGQERGIWSALRCWGLYGAAIAFGVLLALFLITLVGFFCGYADTLACFLGYRGTDEFSAGGRFTRDLALALLAFGGIGMAAWRNREMSRQAKAALNQAEAALTQSRASEEQAKVAQKQIENESNRIAGERFSDAVKMLAQNEGRKPAIAARIGGISVLQSLANNYVSQYAVQVVKTLVAYVKVNAQLTKIPRKDSDINLLGEDVKAAFAVLAQLLDGRDESPEKKFELSDNDLDFSDCDFSRLCLDYSQVKALRHYEWLGSDLRESDLRRADFRKARMYGAQLQGAFLRGADLEGTLLHNVDLRGADLGRGRIDKTPKRTNLQGAELCNADLRGATFYGADLSRANLSEAKLQDTDLRFADLSGMECLLEWSLDQKIWHSDDQPELEGVKSIEISSDRVWDLKPYQNCPYALVGVLRNYKIIYGRRMIPIYSHGLLKAARKLLDGDQLPPVSEKLREWLKKVNPETGEHPDWRAGE